MSVPTGPRGPRRQFHNGDDALANAPRGPRDPKSLRPSGSNRPLHAPEGGSNKANLKRIRDIKRSLAKADIPATVRADLEKELQARHDKKGERKVSAQRATMISRYHMVRFFERKKAERRLKKAQKALAAAEDETEKAKFAEQVRCSEIDIAYTQFHPHLEPYIALFPNNVKDGKKKKADEEAEAEENPDDPFNKPEIWHVIEEAMKEGPAALEKIRDRKNAAAFLQAPLVMHNRPKAEPTETKQDGERGPPRDGERGPRREKGHKKDVKRSGHWQEAAEPEEEDDGEGFFE